MFNLKQQLIFLNDLLFALIMVKDQCFFTSFAFSPQSSRIEDQRSEPPPSAPTVPDEDFFGLILRLQSNRMDDQRSSAPGGRKLQLQPRR